MKKNRLIASCGRPKPACRSWRSPAAPALATRPFTSFAPSSAAMKSPKLSGCVSWRPKCLNQEAVGRGAFDMDALKSVLGVKR